MANKISVLIDVTVDKANRALTDFRKSVADADGATAKFKAGSAAAFTSLKANAGVAAVAAGGALVAFGAKAVKAASDLEESTNAVQKSFGKSAEGVLEIGENSAKSFGLSQAAFNAAAVSFASFAQTVAGPGGDVAQVIEDMTTRAADFASVMNIEVAEASTVFRSGLSGETEPLKKFGIDLSAAAVEAFALSTGLVKSKKDMTESIKVQARYGLLMEKTGQFAGDFADTSDGLANSSRVLGASMTDLSAKLGEQLTPSIAVAVGYAIQLLDVVEAITKIPGMTIKLPGVDDSDIKSWQNFNELQQAAAGGNEKAQEAFRNGGKELTLLDEALGSTSDATRRYEEGVSRLNDAQLINEAVTKSATAATDDEAVSAEDAAKAEERRAQAVRDGIKAQQEMREATLAVANSSLGYRNQVADTTDAIGKANLVSLDGKKTSEEKAQADRDAESAAYDQAAAAVQVASDFAEASGATLSAMEANEVYRAELQKLAPTMSGEARAAVDALIAQLRRAPGEMSGSTFDIGEALSEGIADGVDGSAYKIAEALRAAVEAGKISAKLAARIESPSKLFAEDVGAPIAEGIAEGIVEESDKIGKALERAINDAEKDAMDAAQDLVDAAKGVLDGFWGGIDDARSEDDMREAVADAEANLADVLADGESSAEDVSKARDRLADANYRLAKATVDQIYVDDQSRASWIKTAKAAGLSKQEIDGLVAAYDSLAAAKATASAEADAIATEKVAAQAVRSRFGSAVSGGLINADQLTHLGQFSGDPALQLSIMKEYLNNLDRYFGNVPQYHSGGVVPGAPGSEQLALLQAGETVIPPGGSMGGFNVGELHLHGVQDPDAMVRALRQYARRNGPIQGIT